MVEKSGLCINLTDHQVGGARVTITQRFSHETCIVGSPHYRDRFTSQSGFSTFETPLDWTTEGLSAIESTPLAGEVIVLSPKRQALFG